MRTIPTLRSLALGAAGVVALAVPAGAAATTYTSVALIEPANPGLAVSGTLSDYVVASSARVVVPASWRRESAPKGQLRFLTVNNPSCRYDVTYRATSVLAPVQDAGDHVAAGLPSPGPRYLLDSGERGNRAFRVIRKQATGARVQLDALWAGVLTKRSDIAPSGQAAWTEIRVAAVSRTGSECHSGTWRQVLGPAIGDSLAVTRTSLRFTKKPT
jgi:hypothetical protein